MSTSVTIHCRGNHTLADVVALVGECVGHPLVRNPEVEWDLFIGTSVGVVISVYESDFVDDYGIALSMYAYVVDLDTKCVPLTDPDARACFGISLATVIANYLSRKGCQCIVVKDLNQIIMSL